VDPKNNTDEQLTNGQAQMRQRVPELGGYIKELNQTETQSKEKALIAQALYESPIHGMMVIDTQGTIVFINKIAAHGLGKSAGELIGNPISSFLPKDIAESRKQQGIKTLLSGKPTCFEDRHRRRHYEHHINPIINTDGKVAQLAIFSRDITARKRSEEKLQKAHNQLEQKVKERTTDLARVNELLQREIEERKLGEEALRKQRDRMQQYLDIAGVMFVVIGSDEKVKHINQMGCKILGYSESEIIGENWFDTYVPNRIRDQVRMVFQQILAGDVESVKYHENLILTRNGEEKLIAWHNTVLRNKTGEISATLSSGEDITVRKQMEKSLKRQEKRYRTLLENIPIGVYRNTPGPRGKNLLCNPAFYKMLGFDSEKEIQQVTISDMYCNPKERKAFSEKLQSRGHVSDEEILLRKKNGSTFWGSITAKAVHDKKGSVAYFDCTITDITARKKTEESLHESNERLITVLDSIDADIYAADIETYEIVFVNKHMRESFGNDLIGKRCWKVFRNESAPCAHCNVDKLFDTEDKPNGVYCWEIHNPITNKDYINYDRVITWVDGRYVRLQIAFDITDRKKYESALRQSEMRYRSVVEGSMQGIIIHQNWIIQFANRAAARIFGYANPKEMIGQHALSFADPEEQPELERRTAQIVRGECVQVHDGWQAVRKGDGERIWIQSTGNPISWKGQPAVLSFYTDVTDRKQAELALRESQEKYKMLAESSLTGVFIHQNGKYVFANKKFAEMHGYRTQELLGMDCLSLVHPDDREAIEQRISRTSKGEKWIDDYKVRRLRKDGSTIWCELMAKTIEYKQGPAVMGNIIDVTEGKRAEEQIKTSLAEKEVLLREIHHRVKNNLQVISSLLDMYATRSHIKEAIDTLQDARAKIHTMGLIHTQLYRSKRMDSIDMGGFIRDMAGFLSQTYGTHEKLVTHAIEASEVSLPVSVAIPCSLALTEAISNAYKHAFKDAQKGTIRISLQSSTIGMISMRVKDDGVGIPEQPDIYNGDSLGLTLIRNLVERQLGGKVQIRRDDGTEVVMEFMPSGHN
jgi:PAS domain S-box-containing protein